LKLPILANALLIYLTAKLVWNWKEDVPYRRITALSMSKKLSSYCTTAVISLLEVLSIQTPPKDKYRLKN